MTHIVLVPGFWLGAWAWDDVLDPLRAAGLDPVPVTLPGLAPGDDVAAVRRADHTRAVTDVLDGLDGDVVVVGHSGGGAVLGEVLDRRPDRVRRAVFLDTGPLEDGASLAPDLPADVVALDLPSWDEMQAAGSSIEGIDDAGLERFRRLAVPHPAAVAREPVHVGDPRRFGVPVTAVCTSLPSQVLHPMAHGGPPFHTELGRYDVTYVDLPTGHWAMFSRPADLAAVLVEEARRD
ncbi:alpha/beta fold hydrolase [Cellulomonas sp.]|uniref:alpha/beta fold hydrolase n=1 Tax=Cellulomonas sp. TaxID=40001 RepID=UPI001B138734|nr:alpha/beta fold hydrolase [Cellulomonas sp.]MBO9554534.1 alpha/beta fold hydrolase [Cellulomonas sp.]